MTAPALPAARLLLPAAYTPTPTAALGRRAVCTCGAPFIWQKPLGRIPAQGPCCRPTTRKESAGERVLRRAQERRLHHHYTAAELVHRISQPGWAVVAFEGGITLFTRHGHHQARTLAEALGQADDSGEGR